LLGRELSSERIEFRSIEDEQVGVIHKHQNGACREEISGLLDFDPPWALMSRDHIKTKLDEDRKEDRSVLTGIWSKDEELVGLGCFSAGWDTLCPHIHVLIWPEHRRKGYGSEAARLLLEASFNHYYARVVGCSVPDFDEGALAFAEDLGFKRQGFRRRAGVVNGRFFDLVSLDILRSEYLTKKSQGGDA